MKGAEWNMTRLRGQFLVGSLALLAGAWAVAQWQVNNRVGQVNNRVGGELYGNMGSVRYAPYQTTVLPSEARYATWRSGALPSEVAMQARAVGPLAPNGAIAYVPGPSPLQQAMKTPQPQLYNPAYGIQNQPIDAQLKPQPGYTGSIRYASAGGKIDPAAMPIPAMTPTAARPLPTGQPVSAQLPSAQLPTGQVNASVGASTPGGLLLSQSSSGMGSVRYQSLSK
jgi:hypothetical protein